MWLRRFFIPSVHDLGVGLLLCGGVACAMLGFALTLQYGFGLHPCTLCLYQRWPWGAVALFGLGAGLLRHHPTGAALLGAGLLLALGAGAGIAFYHHGVEQHWWRNAIECSTALPDMRDLAAFKAALLARPVIACDAIPWQFLGLSMAAWNFVLSLGLAAWVAGWIGPIFLTILRPKAIRTPLKT